MKVNTLYRNSVQLKDDYVCITEIRMARECNNYHSFLPYRLLTIRSVYFPEEQQILEHMAKLQAKSSDGKLPPPPPRSTPVSIFYMSNDCYH